MLSADAIFPQISDLSLGEATEEEHKDVKGWLF